MTSAVSLPRPFRDRHHGSGVALDPACQGGDTQRPRIGRRDKTVKRIVLTSSVVAIYGDNAVIATAKDGVFPKQDWNTTSSADHQPYAYSKKVAK